MAPWQRNTFHGRGDEATHEGIRRAYHIDHEGVHISRQDALYPCHAVILSCIRVARPFWQTGHAEAGYVMVRAAPGRGRALEE